ncbi:MAG: hypothetical protein EOP56_16830 [Sphingobacteriales bacterium]|nr:MAG: hypothetical protein EOP56_16830 [Sphingobacteriales bacterium]
MLKRIVYIVLSVWLGILLLFGSTPKEFIHLFADHTDTVHTYHGDGLCIEPEHHHCDFLSFTLAAFIDNPLPLLLERSETVYPREEASVVAHLTSRTVFTSFLRGPPASIY